MRASLWRRGAVTTLSATARVRSNAAAIAPWRLNALAVSARRSILTSRPLLAQSTPLSTQWFSTSTLKDASASTDAEVTRQLHQLFAAVHTANRANVSEADLLLRWESELSPLLLSPTASVPLKQKVARTYELGVSVALRQREYELARALFAQAKRLGLRPSPFTYSHLLHALPVEWLATPPSTAELRAVADDRDQANWEGAVLQLVRAEQQPHFRRSAVEREAFHGYLRQHVHAYLTDYVNTTPRHAQRIAPFNAALRVLGRNGLPFVDLLGVLRAIPSDSRARRGLTLDTFVALLQGARWDDIRHTIDRLVRSEHVVLSADTTKSSVAAPATVWDAAMRAVLNSLTQCVVTEKRPLDGRRLAELQDIYRHADTKLSALFPDLRVESVEQHNSLFELRIKAAAVCGLRDHVLKLLDEYKARAPTDDASALGNTVYLKALEVFPPLACRRVPSEQLARLSSQPVVTRMQDVYRLQREHKHVIALLDKHDESPSQVRALQRRARQLSRRLDDLMHLRALEVGIGRRFQDADKCVAAVLQNGDLSEHDTAVAIALMAQYMTTANRYASGMSAKVRSVVAEETMRRVYALLEKVTPNDGSLDGRSDDELEQVRELYALAAKTAAKFWREEDLEAILQRKRLVFPSEPLSVTDYDRLIFFRVAALDLEGALTLLQEMHNAGTPPTATTIHRIVTGVLHKLFHPRGVASAQQDDSEEEEDNTFDHESGDLESLDSSDVDESSSSAETQPDSAKAGFQGEWAGAEKAAQDETQRRALLRAATDAPCSLEDLTTFLQDQYNLYRITPMAKTIVPVFARLIAANNVPELKRLLQIVESMDGGLTPSTELWLEKRLAAIDKTIDDLRIERRR
ncbi:hypothetical protein ATCC90586_001951 [Pythium insidiosum]|nr:hypothetical protein ATCC90586_001951 [Pythium insidiosum]